MIDRDLATWRDARAHACRAEPKVREAQLACLDGVLARIEVVVQTSQAANGSIDPEDLNRTVRLHDRATAAAAAAHDLGRVSRRTDRDLPHRGEARATFANATRGARHPREVGTLRASTRSVRPREVRGAGSGLHQGDARGGAPGRTMRRRPLVRGTRRIWRHGGRIRHREGPRPTRTHRGQSRADDGPASKTRPALMFEAVRDKKLDEAITRAESAVTKLEKRGCIVCTNQAAVFLIDLMWQRGRSSDFDAFRICSITTARSRSPSSAPMPRRCEHSRGSARAGCSATISSRGPCDPRRDPPRNADRQAAASPCTRRR